MKLGERYTVRELAELLGIDVAGNEGLHVRLELFGHVRQLIKKKILRKAGLKLDRGIVASHAFALAEDLSIPPPPAPISSTVPPPSSIEPRLVVVPPANDGSKGPLCGRCNGSGRWRGRGCSGPCFGCNGSGVARQARAGAS
jgi:hypothetical protein